MKRSLILDTVVRAEFHTLLLVSVYLLFAGHNQPGGGFAGGLVASAAFALRFVAGGPDEARRAGRVQPTTLLGLGLLLATATAIIPMALGEGLLEHDVLSADIALLGKVKTTTVLFFDTGVYLVVLGMVLLVLDVLGGLEEAPAEEASAEESLPDDDGRGQGATAGDGAGSVASATGDGEAAP